MIFSIQMAHILALLTAFGFASSTAAVRYGMRTSSPLTAILTLALVTLALFGPAAVMAVRSQTLDPWGVLTLTLAGIAAPGLAGTCHYMGVRRIGLSRSTSIVGSSPLVAVVLAVPALGERPSALIFFGTFLIVLGIVFLSHGRESVTPEGENRTFWQGAAFAGMASLMFGIAGILRKAGITLVPAISVALCASSIGSLITVAIWQVFAPKVDRIPVRPQEYRLLPSQLHVELHGPRRLLQRAATRANFQRRAHCLHNAALGPDPLLAAFQGRGVLERAAGPWGRPGCPRGDVRDALTARIIGYG